MSSTPEPNTTLRAIRPWKKIAIACAICLALGLVVGYYFSPEKVLTEYKDRIQTVTKTDVVVKERIVRQPDGTETIDRIITDKTETDSTRETEKIKTPGEKWTVSPMAGISASGLTIGAGVSRRLFGPVEVGIWSVLPLASPGSISGGVSVGFRF